jgi:hypothetical protein
MSEIRPADPEVESSDKWYPADKDGLLHPMTVKKIIHERQEQLIHAPYLLPKKILAPPSQCLG